jgi:3-hydroxy acid dehydrogenase / malonic semialdehyde reductase
MKLKDKIVLITGASAGIGLACAELFASEGAKLILAARREKSLKDIAEKLNSQFGTKSHVMKLDVKNRKECESAINQIPDEFKSIDILINNAGLARGLGKIQDGNFDDWEEMIDTNIKGLLTFTRLVVPVMIKKGDGMIINLASVAGRQVYPGGNIYCTTKAAVRTISKALQLDLVGTGVRVSNIDPGMAETEFSMVRFKGDEAKAKKVYEGWTPLTAQDIAETALFCATRPKHVSIQDVLIMATDQASAVVINRKS